MREFKELISFDSDISKILNVIHHPCGCKGIKIVYKNSNLLVVCEDHLPTLSIQNKLFFFISGFTSNIGEEEP